VFFKKIYKHINNKGIIGETFFHIVKRDLTREKKSFWLIKDF